MGNGSSTVLAIRRQGWTSGPRRWPATASRSRLSTPPSTRRRGNSPPTGGGWRINRTQSKPVQIFIRAFPGPGGPQQVTTAGGSQPRWRPDGKELFYVGLDGRLMAVPIAVGADRQLDPGTPVALFRAQPTGAWLTAPKAQYAVAADGRFLMTMTLEAATATPITVVLNWDAAIEEVI